MKKALGLILAGLVLFVAGYFLGSLQSQNRQAIFFENDVQTQKVLQEILNRSDVSVWGTVYESVGRSKTRIPIRFTLACTKPTRFSFDKTDESTLYDNPENGIWLRIN